MVKRRLLTFIYLICGWTGITRLFYTLNRHRPLVLTYHNIIPDALFDDALHLGMSHRLSEFQQQIDLIASRLKVTTDLCGMKDRSCVITFDDGYRNNLLAAEYLERKGLGAIFFVPVEPIVTGRTLVIDRVMRWFSYVPPHTYSVSGEPVTILEGKRHEAYSRFYSWMLRNIEQWEKLPQLLDSCYPFSTLEDLPEAYLNLRFQPMRRDELGRLRAAGHLVGCHSWNHRPLAALSDSAMRADFEACQVQRSLFNVDVYSYPFGGTEEVDERAVELCKSFGYHMAFSNASGRESNNPMACGRVSLPRETNQYVLDAKLSGLESFLKRLIPGALQ